MIRTPPAPALKVKTIEQQNTDFTAEGSPPPDPVGTLIQLKATPALPDTTGVSGFSKRGRTRARGGVPKQSAPKLPHERDESINTIGTIPSETMKQANRDIERGLTDTDRGAEADRTYKKLKQTP